MSERYAYSFAANTHTTWIKSTDKPHTPTSATMPRTEMRWENEYYKGSHRWEADILVNSGTAGATLMQIKHLGDAEEGERTTDFQLRVYAEDGGTFRRYSGKPLKTGVYGRWWNVKVTHDVADDLITVHINNVLVDQYVYQWDGVRVFKNGVYSTTTPRSTAHFRNVRYWKLTEEPPPPNCGPHAC